MVIKYYLFIIFHLNKGLFCNSMSSRAIFSHAIYMISRQNDKKIMIFIINLLLKNLPLVNDSKRDCNQYFDILCKSIEECYNSDITNLDFQ